MNKGDQVTVSLGIKPASGAAAHGTSGTSGMRRGTGSDIPTEPGNAYPRTK